MSCPYRLVIDLTGLALIRVGACIDLSLESRSRYSTHQGVVKVGSAARPLLEFQVLQRRPSVIDGRLVLVGVVVEGLAADGAEAGAVWAAEELGGQG